MIRLLRVSITGMIQFLIVTASFLGLVRIISMFGSVAVAGYTIAIRLIIFTILPSWGFSNAAATLVGQSLGASKPQRAETAVYRTGWYNLLYLGLISITFLIFPGRIISIFTSDPGTASVAVTCLIILSISNLIYAWGMVLTQAFNGAGDTLTPSIINFFAFWVFQIPAAYLLGIHYGFGLRGAFAAIPIADIVLTGSALYWFRRGSWKKQKI
jgi:Na+-driven multidrug efflux pump